MTAPSARRDGYGPLVVVVLLVLAALPRLVTLGADVPRSMAGPVLFDEGFWAHNARNHALYGVWVRDQHNPALFLTPAWTAALRGVYAVLGVGLAQTRLLSAVSGILATLVLYLGLRRRGTPSTALAASFVMALGYFTVLNSRVGYTESFQLLLTVCTFALVLGAIDRPLFGVLAGAMGALSLLAKPSAALPAAAFLAAWGLHWWLSRRKILEPGPNPRVMLWFVLGGGVVLGLLAITLLLPYWHAFETQIGVSLRTASIDDPGLEAEFVRVSLFGWKGLGLVRSAFFTEGAVPLLAVLGLALTRLTGGSRERPSVPELYAWVWLILGLLGLACVGHQPDRRFLFLAPAVAILAAQLVTEGGVRLGTNPSRWRWGLAGALTTTLIAFLCHPALAAGLRAAGILRDLTPTGLASVILSLALIAGTALGVIAGDNSSRLPRGSISWLVFGLAFLAVEPARLMLDLSRPTYTMRTASRELGRLTHDWAPDEKVFTGFLNATLSLENDIFPLVVRDDSVRGVRMNVAPDTPWIPTMHVVSNRAHDEIDAYERRGFAPCRTFALRPAPSGAEVYRVSVLVRRDLAARCGQEEAPPPP